MIQRILILIVFILGVVVSIAFYKAATQEGYNPVLQFLDEEKASKSNNATQEPAPAAPSSVLPLGSNSSSQLDSAASLGLLLKTIQLSQGENGVEVWRLKAEAANMTQQQGIIYMHTPKFTYIMPPDNEELHVNSDSGNIDKENQLLRFIGNVKTLHTKNTMVGELLVYNGTTKTMTFPNGAKFDNPEMYGTADVVVWFMNDQIIDANGSVDVTFVPKEDINSPPTDVVEGLLYNATLPTP